jgi:anti-sigma B factor antagonist
MRILTRQVSEVTILDISGRLTLEGGGSYALRDAVRTELQRGHRNILLNLAEVHYIDSSGNGEIVSAFTTVSNDGGKLKLISLTKRLHDLFQITKLYTVYEIFEDEATAIRSFEGLIPSLRARCPLCKQWSTPSSNTAHAQFTQNCWFCGPQFVIKEEGTTGHLARVTGISMSGNWNTTIVLTCGYPFELAIRGQLNMFSADRMRRLWEVIPAPCCLLLDFRDLTEIEGRGGVILADLLSSANGRVVASLEGFKGRLEEPLLSSLVSRLDRGEALASLGDSSLTPQIYVETGTV